MEADRPIVFPDDFGKEVHPLGMGGWIWRPQPWLSQSISIIGGVGYSFMGQYFSYGDGENTFEMMMDGEIYGHRTVEQINELLKLKFEKG